MIVPQRKVYQKTPNKRGSSEEKRYYKWLHDDGFCCLSGLSTFEIAHQGSHSGMALKPPLETCLPLHPALHREQHRLSAPVFWENVGMTEYLKWAELLYLDFTKGIGPDSVLRDMIEMADTEYVWEVINMEKMACS